MIDVTCLLFDLLITLARPTRKPSPGMGRAAPVVGIEAGNTVWSIEVD
jgi:hypothetical protein